MASASLLSRPASSSSFHSARATGQAAQRPTPPTTPGPRVHGVHAPTAGVSHQVNRLVWCNTRTHPSAFLLAMGHSSEIEPGSRWPRTRTWEWQARACVASRLAGCSTR
jgi:hypothetical protein